MRIVTWNVNSVRLRLQACLDLLEATRPDILCLQETKCPNDKFPAAAFIKAGYDNFLLNGPTGRHGVAILARMPLKDEERRTWCGLDDGRHIAATADGLRIHNFYVPAGGDEPDPDVNPKFAHKLRFLEEMAEALPGDRAGPAILVGDLNVAPRENDVWSHKQLLNVVSHTPQEVERLDAVLATGWVDVARALIPEPERLYTWWSYRARDWRASNRGRRLDHIWVSPDLRAASLAGGRAAIQILDDVRGWERPSDHAPVVHDLAV
jgi:exodeoxyribonuclease-3